MQSRFTRKLNSHAPVDGEGVMLLLDGCMKIRKVAANHDILREGARTEHVLVIQDGWAIRYRVLKNGSRQILAILLPGDLCHSKSSGIAMDHGVAAVTACEIATIPHAAFAAITHSSTGMRLALDRARLAEEAISRAWITNLGRRSARERVAHLLLELFFRARAVGIADERSCRLPLTQALMADALGLTAVHVNRVLRGLREMEVLQVASGTLHLLDAERAAKTAGFDRNYLLTNDIRPAAMSK